MKQPIDPIIEEIHETRRKIAQRFDYDVHRISEDARRRQSLEGRPLWQPRSANQAIRHSGGGMVSESGRSTPADG
jgi:hypothetical protein